MKRILIIAAAAAAAVSCFSFSIINKPVHGNGVITEKDYELASFDEIKVSGQLDVVYSQTAGGCSATLRTDENLIDIYEVGIVGNVLEVSTEKGKSPMPTKGSQFSVCNAGVKSIKINGAGDCLIPGDLSLADNFSFILNGSGDLNAHTVKCNGFTAKVSGSGDIEVDELTAESIQITINGSGDASIGLRDAGDVVVRINGSGDVTLYGSARTLDHKINGSGNVNSRSLSLTGER